MQEYTIIGLVFMFDSSDVLKQQRIKNVFVHVSHIDAEFHNYH